MFHTDFSISERPTRTLSKTPGYQPFLRGYLHCWKHDYHVTKAVSTVLDYNHYQRARCKIRSTGKVEDNSNNKTCEHGSLNASFYSADPFPGSAFKFAASSFSSFWFSTPSIYSFEQSTIWITGQYFSLACLAKSALPCDVYSSHNSHPSVPQAIFSNFHFQFTEIITVEIHN